MGDRCPVCPRDFTALQVVAPERADFGRGAGLREAFDLVLVSPIELLLQELGSSVLATRHLHDLGVQAVFGHRASIDAA